MPLKIHIYTAALNEEKYVDGWVAACKGADGLHVLDTGSKDGTVAELKKRGVHVESCTFMPWKTIAEYREIMARNEAVPWRFDTARNMNLDMVPADADVCIQIDMDEKPVSNWREIIEANWVKGRTTQINYLYGWRMDGERPVVEINYNKCHARHGYIWRKPIHEVICLKDGETESVAFVNQLLVKHYPETKDRSQYLHMLELSCLEFPDDPVDRFYFCRELYFYKRWDAAIEVIKQFLALPRSTWDLQRCMACIYAADCYGAKGDKALQEKWLLRACAEEPNQREGWFSLCEFYRTQGRNLDGYVAARRALAITVNPKSYLQLLDAWGAPPHDTAAITGWYAGFKKEAISHGWDALRLNPFDDHLISNYEIMLSLGADLIPAAGTYTMVDVIVLSWAKDAAQYEIGRRCIKALRQSSPGAMLNIFVVETNKNILNEPWFKSDGFGKDVTVVVPDEKFSYNLFLKKAYDKMESGANYLLILNNDLACFSINFMSEMLFAVKSFPSVSPMGLREARWHQFDQNVYTHVGYDLSLLNGWCIMIDKRIFNAAPFEAFFPAELEFHNQDVYYAAMLEHFGFHHALTTKAQALHLQAKSLSLCDEAEQKRLTAGMQPVLDSLISKNIHKSKVYDCFTFFNELDTLEIRLETLDAIVDKFVLVEATKTHSGKDKPLIFNQNKERFKRFAHKIIHIIVEDMPPASPEWRWTLENFQRNAIMRGLTGCKPTDFVMISDVDEIPCPDCVKDRRFGAYKQTMYNYYYNVRNTVEDWTGTTAQPYSEVVRQTPQNIRDFRHQAPWVRNAGWHFSWIGDLKSAEEKLSAFAHAEYDTAEVAAALKGRMERLVDFAGRSDVKFEIVPIDYSFPAQLQVHYNKYADKILTPHSD